MTLVWTPGYDDGSTYTPGKLVLKKDSVAATDTNINEVSLLLHGDGTNGSTTITDSSLTPKTVTAGGNAQISTAQSKFGGASLLFDGNDYLSVGAAADFPYGTDNFTIECFIYNTTISASNSSIYSQRNPVSNGLSLRINLSKLDFFINNAGTGLFTGSTTLSVDTWYHVALTREGTRFKIWLDGNLDATSGVLTQSLTSTQIPYIGTNSSNIAAGIVGYIDEFRITMGIARYTANFTPPTAPFPNF